MKLNELNHRTDNEDLKMNELYVQFKKLLTDLENRELPDEIVVSINKDIDEINSIDYTGNEVLKQFKQTLLRIIKLLEKELNLFPKNHYRNLWTMLGMAVFGIPMGVAFGTSLGNMAYIGIGLPIGLAIGIEVGDGMDNKTYNEGRQLNIEIKQ